MTKKILSAFVCSSVSLFALSACNDCSESAELQASKVKDALQFNRSYSDIHVESQKQAMNIGDDGVTINLRDNNSYIYHGERSEIGVGTRYKVGDTVKYDFEFSLLDSSGYYQDWDGIWVIVAQWHDQPNREKGETWANFPKNPPPLSYHLRYDDGLKLVLHSKSQDQVFDVKPGSDVKCTNTIHWLYDRNGTVHGSCTIDGTVHSFNFSDQIMLNDYFHYFKFGMYRDKKIDAEMGIELKSLTITNVTADNE